MRLVLKSNLFAPTFFPLLEDNEHDIILLVGGGASGKSYFSFQRAVTRCIQDCRKYLILRNSATDLQRSCWEDVKGILSKWQLLNIVSINKTLKTIDFPNGSQMVFMGLDDSEKIKSIPNITDIIIEECSEIDLDKFSQCKQRLRGNGKLRNQIVLMTNPISKLNWVYKHFFEDGCKEHNALIHQSTYKDNPFINEATVTALEAYKDTNPYFYRVYCLGEFGSLSKQIFSNYVKQDIDIEELRKNTRLQHLVGLDFGYINDPTAIVEALADEETKTLYVTREYVQTGLLNSEIAAQLKLMGLSKSTVIADSAEQKSIDEIKREGINRIRPATKGKGSINQGIQKLQQYKLIVNTDCFNLLEELENYSWKKDKATGEYTNEPIDKYNHCIDALRYSLQCAEKDTRLKTLPKYSL